MLQWNILAPSEVNEVCTSQPNPNLLSPKIYINSNRQPRPQVAFPKAREKRPGKEVDRHGTSQCQWHISKQELLNPNLNLTISRGTEPTAVWKRTANEGSLVPRRSRLGQSWTLPWAVTSLRDTRPLFPRLRADNGARENAKRLGCNEVISRHLKNTLFFLGCYHGNRGLGGYYLCSHCPCYAHSPDRLHFGQILETN